MHAYVTNRTVSLWPQMEACCKTAALWYDSLILPKDIHFEKILSLYTDEGEKEALESLLELYPSGVEQSRLNVYIDDKTLVAMREREEELWSDYSRGVAAAAEEYEYEDGDEDWNEDDEDGPPYLAYIPPELRKMTNMLEIIQSTGALATFGIESKMAFEWSKEGNVLTEALPLSATGIICTPCETEVFAELKMEQDDSRALETLGEVIEINIPDVSFLTWRDILKLRKNYDNETLREAFEDNDKDAKKLQLEFETWRRKLVRKELLNPIPKATKTIAKGLLGEFPGVGISISLWDAKAILARSRRFATFSFMNELEKIGARDNTKN